MVPFVRWSLSRSRGRTKECRELSRDSRCRLLRPRRGTAAAARARRTDGHRARPVLASIHTRQVDFADLYFQYSRVENWSLEEGIVKSGSFSIDRGVGIRAVHGEKQAFAYSDDITLPALEAAAAATRAIGRQGQSAVAPLREARHGPHALCSGRPGDLAARRGEGGAARAAGANGARARPARRPGDGVAGRRVRRRARRALRRLALRRRASAGARVADGDRRGGRAAGAGLCRRRRSLRLRVLHRRGARRLRDPGRRAGGAQPRRARGAGRHDDGGARQRLAGHPAARGDRPRPRRRLQPQGDQRLLGPHRAARRRRGHHRRRRRHARCAAAGRSPSTTRAIRRSARC